MGEYHHGDMNISEQKRTFGGFLTAIQWIVGICLAVVIFLALVNS